jgi:hypothetical protein
MFLVWLSAVLVTGADHVRNGAVVAVVVVGPFVAGLLIVVRQLGTRTKARASPVREPRWLVGLVGLMLWGVAPALLISRVRLDRGISDFEIALGLVSPLVGGLLVGAATRGQGRLLTWAFGLLVAATVVTLFLMEPGGGEATVILLVVTVPTAAIALCAGGSAAWLRGRESP